MVKRVVLVLTLALVSGCASSLRPDNAVASAPFLVDQRGRLIVKLSLNGRAQQPFIVDSAASISAVYEDYLVALKVPMQGNQITVHGLSASGPRPLLSVDSVRLGKARWDDVAMVALPTPAPDPLLGEPPVGILGHDLLARFGVAFDVQARVVHLYSHETMARRHYAGWSTVKLTRGASGTPAGSIYFFTVAIEGVPARAVFDLGSGVNIVNWHAARAVGLAPSDYAARRTPAIGGILGETASLPRFIAGHIATGRVGWREEIFSIADVDIFGTLAMSEQPAALLGAGLFVQRDFVIDFARERLLIRGGAEVSR